MTTVINNVEDWLAFATGLVSRLQEGDVIALSGPLGAGKTTLVQALCQALGAKTRAKSPTFTLMNTYQLHDQRFKKLVHVDAYRLENETDALALDMPALCTEAETLICVEWPEKLIEVLQACTGRVWCVKIEHADGETRMVRVKLEKKTRFARSSETGLCEPRS